MAEPVTDLAYDDVARSTAASATTWRRQSLPTTATLSSHQRLAIAFAMLREGAVGATGAEIDGVTDNRFTTCCSMSWAT